MKRFLNSYRAEWLKVFTTRSWWILALVMALYIGFTAAVLSGLMGSIGMPDVDIDGINLPRMVYALAPTLGYIFPVLLGALSVTVEYRHGTLGPTFIWAGGRERVLGAKVAVQFVMGLVYGVIGIAAAVLASVFFFLNSGINTALGDGETWLQFLRTTVDMGIWAVLGLGVGILVKNQAAAIVIVIVFTQFVEPMARLAGAVNEKIGNIVGFLPGAASDAFAGNSVYSVMSTGSTYHQLSWWAGGLVLLGYACVALIAGAATRWRADVG